MKKTTTFRTFGPLILLAALSAFSQVQLFEQDLAGVHPYVGLKWNSNITQPMIGFEYNIEGRTSLGLQAAKPLKDSLKIPGLNAFQLNPYAIFEFIEPGNLTLFSFAMRADFIYEDITRPDSNYNSFSRSSFGGGPVFAMRFQTSEHVVVIPEVSYELYYVSWRWTWVNPPANQKGNDQQTGIDHDIIAGVNLMYRFNEASGINFEPKFVAKVGSSRQSSDLINAELIFGYFATF